MATTYELDLLLSDRNIVIFMSIFRCHFVFRRVATLTQCICIEFVSLQLLIFTCIEYRILYGDLAETSI